MLGGADLSSGAMTLKGGRDEKRARKEAGCMRGVGKLAGCPTN